MKYAGKFSFVYMLSTCSVILITVTLLQCVCTIYYKELARPFILDIVSYCVLFTSGQYCPVLSPCDALTLSWIATFPSPDGSRDPFVYGVVQLEACSLVTSSGWCGLGGVNWVMGTRRWVVLVMLGMCGWYRGLGYARWLMHMGVVR